MKRPLVALAVSAGILGFLRFTGCQVSGVGDPCVPESEGADQTAPGGTGLNYFNIGESSGESKSFQCQTRLCLVNHLQGRVSCPFGQPDAGIAPAGAATSPNNCADLPTTDPGYCGPCVITGTTENVPGPVPAQCANRTTDTAVYCSCRCANADGRTDDGADYCSCPDGFTCAQNVIPKVTTTDTGITGAFCIKNGTAYNAATACTTGPCDPTKPLSDQPGCHQ